MTEEENKHIERILKMFDKEVGIIVFAGTRTKMANNLVKQFIKKYFCEVFELGKKFGIEAEAGLVSDMSYDDGQRSIIHIICEEKKNHSPRSGAGRVLTYLLTKLGQQEDY